MSDKLNHSDLTKLTLFFGKVPETHIKSMQSYPFIFFNDLEDVSLNYVVGTKDDEPTVINYDLNLKLETNNEISKRYAALEESIHKLFWKEAKVIIKINGEEVYKSE